jgi:DNA-binding CsgD family transcriptional regulator/uncharacterized membrane protein YgcG
LVLSACGLAALSLWTDMIGHASALLASADAVAPFANARSFYLIGLSLGAAPLVIAPRRLQKLAASIAIQLTFGLLASGLTLSYGLAAELNLLPVDRLVILSLAGIGLGFAWFSSQLLCLLSQAQRYRPVLLGIAAGLLLKTALSPLVENSLPISAQSACAMLLPLVATVMLLLSRRCFAQHGLRRRGQGDSQHSWDGLWGGDVRQKPSTTEDRMLLILLVATALLRAVIRLMSAMGFWGSGYDGNILLGPLDLVLIALLLLATLWATTLRHRPGTVLIARFLPGFLVVLAGLILLDPQVTGLIGLAPRPTYLLNIFVELFTHLFFWGIIVFGMRSLTMPALRVAGIVILAYALTSFASSLAFNRPDASYRLLAVALLYAFIVVLMLVFTMSHKAGAATGSLADSPDSGGGLAGGGNSGGRGSGGRGGSVSLAGGVGNDGGGGGGQADATAGMASEDRIGAMPTGTDIARLTDLAKRSGLSPRETEVFILLARGRNRPFIQQRLYLADGTVKTHISRIYQKLGVADRQALITLVQAMED